MPYSHETSTLSSGNPFSSRLTLAACEQKKVDNPLQAASEGGHEKLVWLLQKAKITSP
jgi:hypothetical protein